MQEAVIRNLPEKTGKSLDEWLTVAMGAGISKPADLVKWLKSVHKLGHVQAQTVVGRMSGQKPYIETAFYEENLFHTEALWYTYTQVKSLLLSLGTDVTCRPCKTYIPFYRKTQFAVVALRKGEAELGLVLGGGAIDGLEPAHKLGGSGRISHSWKIQPDATDFIHSYLIAAYQNN